MGPRSVINMVFIAALAAMLGFGLYVTYNMFQAVVS